MLYLILALAALGIIAALTTIGSRHHDEEVVITDADCGSCNGDNAKCEQECMMEAATKPIEYFDDEELDKYRHRPSDCYTDDEADEFAEVMYTMKPDEVKEWNRSLILREINVPNQIKDEMIAMME